VSERTCMLDGSALPPDASGAIQQWAPAKPTIVFETYWRFAAERQAIFFRRLDGATPPYSEDPILQRHRFTNTYRASDRVSQYLIRNVIYLGSSSAESAEEVFFRTILFKIFNRISTWELLKARLGAITYRDYSFRRYDRIVEEAMNNKQKVFSAAYIMPSGRSTFGSSRKHRNYLRLLEAMMRDEVPKRLVDTASMQEAFDLLHSYPLIGNFLAYQYVTDINYSEITHFSEMDFVVPGPGARDGIHKCFSDLGGLTEVEIIRLMADRQEQEFARLGLEFKSLWGRRLRLIDCQNVFCEVSKYARLAHPEILGLAGRTRIKQVFRPNTTPIDYWFPPKWGLNDQIRQYLNGRPVTQGGLPWPQWSENERS